MASHEPLTTSSQVDDWSNRDDAMMAYQAAMMRMATVVTNIFFKKLQANPVQ